MICVSLNWSVLDCPLLSWAVLDCFRLSCVVLGCARLSSALLLNCSVCPELCWSVPSCLVRSESEAALAYPGLSWSVRCPNLSWAILVCPRLP